MSFVLITDQSAAHASEKYNILGVASAQPQYKASAKKANCLTLGCQAYSV